MRFERRFLVQAPVEDVAEFHRHPAALTDISPPFPPVQVLQASDPLVPGDRMILRMWFGPIPILWEAELEEVPGYGFADRQIRGPFAFWRHEHLFEEASGGTWVVDRIEARLARNLFKFLAGGLMWAGLPVLFRYRAWKTRRLLETRFPKSSVAGS